MPRERVLDILRQLHHDIDEEAAKLAAPLELRCGLGCCSCCVDELGVFEVEAERIIADFPEVLRDQTPAPQGRCALLDESGACRVYAARPYVCRTQGLPLRWLEPDEDDVVNDVRDICELNLDTVALEELAPESCWPIGPVEQRLSLLEQAWGGVERVKLRSLFERVAAEHRPGEDEG